MLLSFVFGKSDLTFVKGEFRYYVAYGKDRDGSEGLRIQKFIADNELLKRDYSVEMIELESDPDRQNKSGNRIAHRKLYEHRDGISNYHSVKAIQCVKDFLKS